MRVLTISQQRKVVRYICKQFGVRFRFLSDIPEYCDARVESGVGFIQFSKRLRTFDEIVSVTMHEVCHVLAAKQGKYKDYHASYFYTRKEMTVALKTAANAEAYVDVMAEKMTSRMFPGVKFTQSYRTRAEKQEMHKLYKHLLLKKGSWS